MRALLLSAFLVAPSLVWSQSPSSGSSVRPAAASAAKPVRKPLAKARTVAPAAATVAQEPLDIEPERLALAPLVLTGGVRCDGAQQVELAPHPTLQGRFLLKTGKAEHTVSPQLTNTGVIRLENAARSIVWLQVPIKSMLMDVKKGQRTHDNCLHAEQMAEVERAKAATAAPQAQ